MLGVNLGKEVKPIRSSNAVAAGTSAINGAVVDMQGYEGVLFIAGFGAITAGAVTSLKAQQGDQSGGGDQADLAGTAVTVPDTASNKLAFLDVFRPTKRYVRGVVSRATQNAVLDFLIAIPYGSRKKPPALDATVTSGKTVVSPDAGTP